MKYFMFLLRLSIFILLFFSLSVTYSKSYANEVFSEWTVTNPLPYSLASHGSYSFSNKLFTLGGANSIVINSNLETALLPNGHLTGWTNSSTDFPYLFYHSLISKENTIYILGGSTHPPTLSTNKVLSGTINSNGSISDLSTQPPLPKGLSLGSSAIVGNKIYFAGGFTQPSNEYNNKIYVASIINSEGDLSSWIEAGTLPSPMIGHGLIAKNGNLYLIGGYTGSTYSNRVYKTTPNPDGSISSWQELSSLPTAVYRGGYVEKDNYLITVAGADVNGQLDSVYYASILPNGSISSWTTSTHKIPKKLTGGSVVIAGDFLYMTGGYNDESGSYLNTVYFTKLSTSNILPVPLLKQTDSEWKDTIYNHAQIWSPTNSSIEAWGCAITSATMVFQYHGINKLPDNQPLTPASLNSWLTSQPDGYVQNGWVNWIALSRLSRLAKQSGNNPSFAKEALEYMRFGTASDKLKEILSQNIPGILEEPGHFIVAKGTSGNTFSINDPYYPRTQLSDGYNNTFTSLGVFSPSNTDLSYFLINSPNFLSLTLKTSSGSALTSSFIQQPIQSATPSAIPSGNSFSLLLTPKPESGNYIVEIKSNQQSSFSGDLYLYDIQGNVQKAPFSGFISATTPQTISFSYNKEGSSSASIKRLITFKSTLEDIKIGTNLKLISKELSLNLTYLITTAETLSKKQITKSHAKQTLTTFEGIIKKWQGTPALSKTAGKILLENVQTLLLSF